MRAQKYNFFFYGDINLIKIDFLVFFQIEYTFFRNIIRNPKTKVFFPIFAQSLTKTLNIMQLLTIGWAEVLLIALIVLLLFGAKKIPELMQSLGKGMKSFKDGMNGKDDTDTKKDNMV